MRRIAMLCCLFFAFGAAADVLVVFKIESAAMKSRYSANLAGLEKAVAAKIAKDLKEKTCLPQWTYVIAGSPAGTVEIQVHSNRTTKEHWFTVEVRQGGIVQYTGKETWLEPGEFDRDLNSTYPELADAPTDLAAAVKEHLLSVQATKMFPAMRDHIPIAVRSEWIQPRLGRRQEQSRIVAALQWSDTFGASMFRVMCEWRREGRNQQDESDDGLIKMLLSRGLLIPVKFNDAGKEYDALALKPMRRIIGDDVMPVERLARSEVEKLKPLAVYLLIFDPQGLEVAR